MCRSWKHYWPTVIGQWTVPLRAAAQRALAQAQAQVPGASGSQHPSGSRTWRGPACGCSPLSSPDVLESWEHVHSHAWLRLYPPQASASPDTCPLSVFVCACTACRFDCILLDIMMVRTNGVDVAVTLRQAFADSATPLPPLVAMTANSSPSDEAM
jgi:CheY-like chemotaxis protein